MKPRFFKKKRRSDLDYIYWSIGEDLGEAESQITEARKRPDAAAATPPVPTLSTNEFRASAKKNPAKEPPNIQGEDDEVKMKSLAIGNNLEPPASRRKSLRSKESTTYLSSLLSLGRPLPRTESLDDDADEDHFIGTEDNFTTPTATTVPGAVTSVKKKDDILIPDLDEYGDDTSIGSSSVGIRRRHLPLLRKKNKRQGGELLSNPVHSPFNASGGGTNTPAASTSGPLQKLNSRTSRNWSEDPPAPNRWHHAHDLRDDDDDDDADGHEDFREDRDEYGPTDPLVDDICNQSRPVGCVSIAVTAGIAALWLL